MPDAPTTLTDREQIERVITLYVDSGRAGDSERMSRAFHDDATIFGYIGDELFGGSIRKLYDWIDETGPATDLQADIAAIDVAHSIATVRLELHDWTGYRFTDQFTLLKVDGAWTIISKVFHLHA